MVWGAFIGLCLLVVAGVGLTLSVLRMEQKNEYEVIEQSRPLLDSVREMDESLATMVSAARGMPNSPTRAEPRCWPTSAAGRPPVA